jgi:transposase InsO family protein
VESIIRALVLKGVPTRRLAQGARVGRHRSLNFVRRVFRREQPNHLWMTDLTEHPTSEGKVYCFAVLDPFARLVVGWAVHDTQATNLVLNALRMATRRRGPRDVIHSFQGRPEGQFTPWAFSQRVRDAGIAPSMGSVGTPADNAMIELLNKGT